MLSHELLEDMGALESADFEALAEEVDPYIEKEGELHGLLIVWVANYYSAQQSIEK